MEKFKLTRGEKAWILYDVGNSAFILLVSTIIPIYFNALAAGEGPAGKILVRFDGQEATA